jgi:Variant SH3 domain
VYTAITKYAPPPDSDGLPLEEGDQVELLDNKSPDRWLCRLVGRPKNQGWVPPSYLVSKSEDKLDTRTTQEVFREDIIKISNKQQEAIMKRRYVKTWSFQRYCIIQCLIVEFRIIGR